MTATIFYKYFITTYKLYITMYFIVTRSRVYNVCGYIVLIIFSANSLFVPFKLPWFLFLSASPVFMYVTQWVLLVLLKEAWAKS